jgi:glycosyltransferase involved in cell wall biosynthesis
MKLLFISYERFVKYKIAGGVQLCTEEFLEYFKLAKYEVETYLLGVTTNKVKRLKIKFGLEVYDMFDFEHHAKLIAKQINEASIKIVALNQVNLSPLIPYIKLLVPKEVKFICLSHGNETGDYLHDITENNSPNYIQNWKLGKQLVLESTFFKSYYNGVIVISEHEIFINKWLGAQQVLFLPRILYNNFINWNPTDNRIGFVGTLEHLPNKKSIELVAKSLKELNFKGELRLVGGSSEVGNYFKNKFSFINYLGKLSDEALKNEVVTWELFLNPVFWYSRGSSTKLAQALNWGIPVLSTPAGRRGYIFSNNEFIVDNHNPQDFAIKIIEVTKDKSLLGEIKSAVEESVNTFDKNNFVNQLDSFVKSLL